MILRRFLFLCFFLSLPVSAATWVEDSLSLQFKYPRGWIKNVTRNDHFMKIDLFRPDGARITIDSYRRDDAIELDRYVEYRIDLMLKTYPDLKIKAEKKFGSDRGFDDVIFIVINYTEKDQVVSNRILFSKKADVYHSVQCKTWLKNFNTYKKPFDIVTKSFRYRSYVPGKWRNDSLFYLDPEKDANKIQKIRLAEPKDELRDESSQENKRPLRPEPTLREPQSNTNEVEKKKN